MKPKKKKQPHDAAPPSNTLEWEKNNEIIYSAFISIATTKKRYPQIQEISDKTGIPTDVIILHLDQIDFESIKKKYKIFADAALFQLASKAISGTNKQWTELFFKVMFGLGEKQNAKQSSNEQAPPASGCRHYIYYNEKHRTYECMHCRINCDDIR